MKKSSRALATRYEALEIDGPTAMTIAEAEGLDAHARAVALRLESVMDDIELVEEIDASDLSEGDV